MNIDERINRRTESNQRITSELKQIEAQLQALNEQRQKLIAEAIGNNEVIKELRELKQQGA